MAFVLTRNGAREATGARRQVALALVIVLMWLSSAAMGQDNTRTPTVKLSGTHLVASAIDRPSPVFPESSLARRSVGPIVLDIFIEPNGSVRSVTVIEAPDQAIRNSVHAAVGKWKFAVFLDHQKRPAAVVSKLILYSVVRYGRGQILPADDIEIYFGQNASVHSPFMRRSKREAAVDIASERAVLLDVRPANDGSMDAIAGVHIPLSHLASRARLAFDDSQVLFLDCTTIDSTKCSEAERVLSRSGLSRVAILDRP